MGVFKKLIYENLNEEDTKITFDDVVNMIKSLNFNEDELQEFASHVVDRYVVFSDEIDVDMLQDLTDIDIDDDDCDDCIDQDGDYDYDDYDYNDDNTNITESPIVRRASAERMSIRRKEKKIRRNPSVKKDLQKRAQKKCASNQRVTKISKGVYKCVPKTSKDKIKSKRLKKFHKLYNF